MASLQGIINPSQETIDPQLERNALIGQDVPRPTLSGWASSQTQNALEQGVTYNLLGKGYSAGDNKYSQQQLEVMHPEVPKDFWKGGATAFQAEMIMDKRKKQQQNEEMKQFLLGSNPDWAQKAGMWTLGMGIDLGAGLTDPITLAAFGAAGKVASVAGESIAMAPSTRVMARIMQEPLEKISNTFMGKIATSRAAHLFGHELAINTLGEAAVMYPLKRAVLDEWTKGEETTLSGTIQGAFGSALAFSALKYVGGGLWNKAKGAGSEFTDRTREYFTKGKDKANAHVNSEVTNEATVLTAAADALTSDHGVPAESISEKMSNKAFTGLRDVVFNSSKAFTGLFEKTSGKSDYLGERFGNTHVFLSDPNATQGMFDTVAKNGNEFDIYGHDGNINTIDLEGERLVDYQEIIDILDNPMNMNPEFLDTINEDMTLAEVFKKVNDYSKENGMSGKDIVEMFDKINKVFISDGYEGTTHTESMGKTKHTVLSVFDEALKSEHIEKIHSGETTNPIDPTPEVNGNTWSTKEVDLGNGEKVPVVDEIPEDDYYSNDQEALDAIDKWDINYLIDNPPIIDEVPDMVKDLKEKLEDLFKDTKQSLSTIIATQERFHGSDKIFEQFKDDFAGHRNGAMIGRGHYFGKRNLARSFSRGGFLYESTIPDSTNLIEADKFISNQSIEIKTKIEKMFEKNPELDSYIQSKLKIEFPTRKEILGLHLYELIRDFLVQKGDFPSTSGEIQAGKFLADNGIKGATWLYDQPNEHTVIYNAEDIKIKSINEIEFEKIKEEMDRLKEDYANNKLEDEPTIAKAMENCIRMH